MDENKASVQRDCFIEEDQSLEKEDLKTKYFVYFRIN